MAGAEDPLGALLSRAGALSGSELTQVLELQRAQLPLASLCYVLGLADEDTLAAALALQLGVPAVVLDRSIIALDVLDGAAAELALENQILPLAEDRHRLLVACERPPAVRDVLREMEFIKGKPVVAHVALKVTLARTLRAVARARTRGETIVVGPSARKPDGPVRPSIALVPAAGDAPDKAAASAPASAPSLAAPPAVVEDITREVGFEEMLSLNEDTAIETSQELLAAVLAAGDERIQDEASGERAATSADLAPPGDGVGTGTEPSAAPVVPPSARPVTAVLPPDSGSGPHPLVSANTAVAQIIRRGEAIALDLIDLDSRDGVEYRPFRGPPGRILVVDDDFASRQLLAKELAPLGYEVQTASHGGEALARITGSPPDVVVVDIMLPEVDGFHICRAVKGSRKYNRIAVVLISAVIDSGRVTDEVVQRHGADAYFEKPLHMDRIKARLQSLLAARGVGDVRAGQQSFERAMSLYQAGNIDAAVGELRRGIEEDPLSAKHHFVLANILHKKSLIFEAIDEYEATLELKPDYFPALTRLAYLYYKQGYSARAIDTWRRSLPLCADPALRHNIELFMRKLISEIGER
jgi:CheY-like chemotaxis protein